MTHAEEIRPDERGFATLEILAAATLVAITLLSIAAMYLTAHTTLERSGNTTVTVALGRRILEDLHAIPFENLVELNGFDTDNPSTLPANEPERDIARRWRYAVAGDGAGWGYTATEMLNWPTFDSTGAGMRGVLQVDSPTTSMRQVTVTISAPRQPKDLQLSTLLSRTSL